MRTAFFIGLLLLGCGLQAQDEEKEIRTLFGNNGDIDHGGWGGPMLQYGQIMDQDALFVGGRGGWLIDHRLTVGGAGYGLASRITNKAYDKFATERNDLGKSEFDLQMGYGGLLLEPTIHYDKQVHISIPIVIGGGGCNYSLYRADSLLTGNGINTYETDDQGFFFVQATAEAEFNIIDFVRLGLGVGYMHTSTITLPETDKDVLNGARFQFVLKFGSF
jgi:hypothetical protein